MKNNDKRQRATLKEPGDYIKFEPYRSIVNSLRLAPTFHEDFEGTLETKELRYLIVKGYDTKSHKGFRKPKKLKSAKKKTLIELFKKNIESNPDIKLNQSISTTPQGFNKFLKKLKDGGQIEKTEKKGLCRLSERYKLEILNLRKSSIIMDTDFEHIIFCPPGYNYTFYNPSIPANYIKYNVEDYDRRIKNVEENLQKAHLGWIRILREARDNQVREIWDVNILCYKNVHVLPKFLFCLETIYEVEEILIWDHPKRSPNEQWELLMKIHDRATNRYIKKSYPGISSSQMDALEKIALNEVDMKSKFFENLDRKIRSNLDLSLLESIIVIDTPGIGPHRYDDLAEAGITESLLVDRNKPISKQRVKKKKASERQPVYDAKNKYLTSRGIKTPVDKGLYVKPPFFKGFFKGFEKDLMRLGFKSGNGEKSLEYFYNRLDGMAEILRIPSLPNDLDVLLQK